MKEGKSIYSSGFLCPVDCMPEYLQDLLCFSWGGRGRLCLCIELIVKGLKKNQLAECYLSCLQSRIYKKAQNEAENVRIKVGNLLGGCSYLPLAAVQRLPLGIKLLTVLACVTFPRTLVPVCVIYYNKILSFSCWQMTCNIYRGLGFVPVETFQIK